jgi:hypothetical protein
MDWAWQQTVGENHVYDIWFPQESIPPVGHVKCPYDKKASLEIYVPGMGIQILETGENAYETIKLENLDIRYPDGHAHVKLRRDTKPRGVYQFEATWNDSLYFTSTGCKRMDHMFHPLWTKPVHWPPIIKSWRDLDPIASDGPDWRELDFVAGGGFVMIEGIKNEKWDVIISSTNNNSVVARLYNSKNILVSESTPIDSESLRNQIAESKDGSSAHLIANSLNEQDRYFLHVLPGFDKNGAEVQHCRIALNSQGETNA